VTSRERICEVCGELRPPKNKRFCSKKCNGKWQSGENNPRYNPETDQERSCEFCGTPLTRRQIGFGNRFCSKGCNGKGMSENLRGINHHRYRPELHEGFCKICGEPLTKRRQVIVCSSECSGKWRSGENNYNWRGGVSFKPYGKDFSESLKERIRERDNHECQYCGTLESELYQRLSCHHINYQKADNREENLISLCQECHNKTNYRRWYWEAYFKLKVQERDSIQSRLHLIPQQERPRE